MDTKTIANRTNTLSHELIDEKVLSSGSTTTNAKPAGKPNFFKSIFRHFPGVKSRKNFEDTIDSDQLEPDEPQAADRENDFSDHPMGELKTGFSELGFEKGGWQSYYRRGEAEVLMSISTHSESSSVPEHNSSFYSSLISSPEETKVFDELEVSDESKRTSNPSVIENLIDLYDDLVSE
ncbi:unnamed protein product [Kuraishia capsulata CBS 1993]|uniref:Uncharacterized protein n=1 Tax=Kuraishia capsulata CBS 1993 TaxID=1382522 RepID=W6MX83_9ASCO|nr:uncharacterized protein KUCA_T00004422001 [Kuraishia capsulata CBS 1993]CDK28440.1 unnamed protein product [Kuraishia capsulata CBS 1993]